MTTAPTGNPHVQRRRRGRTGSGKTRFLSDPAVHSVDSATAAPGAMVQHLFTPEPGGRAAVVATLAGGSSRSLVFTRTKHGAQKLGADGVVITLQTPARAADVRGLMRHAGVRPQSASVSPSALLRAIAGPPAGPATGRGAAARSAGYRGRRRK